MDPKILARIFELGPYFRTTSEKIVRFFVHSSRKIQCAFDWSENFFKRFAITENISPAVWNVMWVEIDELLLPKRK